MSPALLTMLALLAAAEAPAPEAPPPEVPAPDPRPPDGLTYEPLPSKPPPPEIHRANRPAPVQGPNPEPAPAPEPRPDPAPAGAPDLETPPRDVPPGPVAPPAAVEPLEPDHRPRPREPQPSRVLVGIATGSARGSVQGLALSGDVLELSADFMPRTLQGFDGLRLSGTLATYWTPAELRYAQYRPSLSFLWTFGPLRTALGAGVTLAILRKATYGGISSLLPFARFTVGADIGPVGPLYPFIEVEGTTQVDVWLMAVRVGLRFELSDFGPQRPP